MNGIHGASAAKQVGNGHAKRLGAENHPGKHLGQFKHAQVKPNDNTTSLIQNQIKSLNTNNKQVQQSPDYSNLLVQDALRSTNNSISDMLSFNSHFNAITTVY